MDDSSKNSHSGSKANAADLNSLNPYINGPFRPIADEVTATDMEVIGEIPADLYGGYYRNGPNPQKAPKGMHHWFDGDAMLHGIYFENGKAEYRNRYVRTQDFVADKNGTSDVGGVLEPANRARANKVYKDTGNTDVIIHNGELMALWYVSGTPVRVNPRTLETIRDENFGGALPRNVSAHSKNDNRTGEFLFFDYSLYEPWMSFGVVGADNQLSHFTEIELPGPRLPHDMGVTENYVILHDLPVLMTEQGLRQGMWSIHQPAGLPARFGVLPRKGRGDEIKWFEVEPCYIYHVINSWEEGDEVIMHACKMMPNSGLKMESDYGPYKPMVGVLALKAVPVEWRLNMKTGEVKSRQYDDRLSEFPMINLDYAGCKNRYSYNASLAPRDVLLLDGIYKYDLESADCIAHKFENGVYGSEPAFAPRIGSVDEDDGYVITFAFDENTGASEARILDARNMADRPLARIKLPQRVPAGFHATWATGEQINSGKKAA